MLLSYQVAIACWEWVLVSRKDLETKLQHNILNAWLFTVHRKCGIFEEDVPPVNPLTLNDYDTIEHRSANVEPQDLWLQFLTERFNVVQSTPWNR